jgi:hypothetical protein
MTMSRLKPVTATGVMLVADIAALIEIKMTRIINQIALVSVTVTRCVLFGIRHSTVVSSAKFKEFIGICKNWKKALN